ncbi:MAG: hypothetical protein H6858_04925 [Rhodospirillales bacterium]|nr:hypothetical protein [Rhodospirillales bacterium]
MNTPVKRITASLQNHAVSPGADQATTLDDMASHNLAGFFGTLFEIDQRLQAESRQPKNSPHENQ